MQKYNIKHFLSIIYLFSSLLYCQQRIVSLTPSITTSLYLLGEKDNVVGITLFCKKISDTQKVVGSYLTPNIEEIVKLDPQIVFVSKEGIQKEVVEHLRKFKLNIVVLSPVNTYEDVKQQFLQISKYLNKQNEAKKIIQYYESQYRVYFHTKKVKNKKRVLCIIGLHPLIVASDKSFIGEVIKFAGGENCVINKLRYPQLNPEEIIKLNPDIIILPEMGIKKSDVKNFLANFTRLTAVENDKIFVVPADILCQPNIHNFFKSVEEIAKLLK